MIRARVVSSYDDMLCLDINGSYSITRNLNDVKGLYRRMRKDHPDLAKPPVAFLKKLLREPRSSFGLQDTKLLTRVHSYFDTLSSLDSILWVEFCSKENMTGFGRVLKPNHEQYFTSKVASEFAVNTALSYLTHELKHYTFIEPAAGTGMMYKCFPPSSSIALDFDLELCSKFGWIHHDFLLPRDFGPCKSNVVITNPPYGNCKQFLERALEVADLVVMILPLKCSKKSFTDSVIRNGTVSFETIELSEDMQRFLKNTDESILVKQPSILQVWKRR